MNRETRCPTGESTRRGFFATILGVGLTLLARRGPAADKIKKVAVDLAKVGKLAKVGGWGIFKLKDRDVLFVRDGEKSVRAYDPTCSHQKCTVAFEPKENAIHCPCHRSVFALDGKVVSGPAPKPLTLFPVTLEADRIIVSLPEP